MHAGFCDWGGGGQPNVWGSVFQCGDKTLLLDGALKFEVIFQNISLKLLKIWKIIDKASEKCNFSLKIFSFAAELGEIRIII